MTLPQGYKTFSDGSVLTADEINGYLQQGILVFDNTAERTTALTGNLREGMYSYLKSDNTTYVYDGTAWQRVGKQDVETDKNFQAFTGSGGTTVPAWATKMYYLVVRGGNSGGAGGQVLQGNTTVTGGTSLTITVGGAASNSSVAISGGSTFTANTTGAAAGANGTQPTAPFNVGYFGGGGGSERSTESIGPAPSGFCCGTFSRSSSAGGFGGGGNSSSTGIDANGSSRDPQSARAGAPNSGGGGGGSANGGSGIVLLYFS